MINTIIFDFAGVLTKEGFRAGLFRKLKEKFDFDALVLNERFLLNEESYMSGQMSTQVFWENLCQGMDIPYSDFVESFMSSYEYNPRVLGLVKELKSYKLVLLSDNFEVLSGKIRKELNSLFEKMFFSDEIKMTKNSPAAFHTVLSELQLKPEECLFIDDKEKNLVYPKSIGFHIIHYKDPISFKNQLSEEGIILSI